MRHPLFARYYARFSPRVDAGGLARHRQGLLDGLAGEVVEVGAGNGLNFPHYPTSVTRVLAVEPEPYLRDRAREAAARAPVPVDVVDGVAEALPAQGASFDGAVMSLTLCSVGGPAAALSELRRVLQPGGQLHFLEHVLAPTPRLARVQRFLDATLWPRLNGGCHTARDTVGSIERAGFRIERLERFRFPPTGPPLPASPFVRGVATAPADHPGTLPRGR